MKTWKAVKFANKPWVKLNLVREVKPKRKYVHQKVALARQTRKGFCSQAERIFTKFGGVRRLVECMKVAGFEYNTATVYKWSYPYPKGSNGVIPTRAWDAILSTARHEGITLTPQDMRQDHYVAEPRTKYARRVVV